MRIPITIAIAALCYSSVTAQEVSPPKPVVLKVGEQEKARVGEKAAAKASKAIQKAIQKAGAQKSGDKKKADPKKQNPKPYRQKTKEELEEEKGPFPRGTDPADLKVLKGAQEMIRAEKRLAELVKAGKIKGIDQVLPFEEIASWPYEDGLKGMPKKLRKLDGKKVMMTGFMLPIDEVENIKEFLLVQSLWSCCYGQPPDINGTVRVVMKGKKRIDYKFEPIKIIGTFRIQPTIEDGFCVDIYQLETESVEVIK